ncbi:MAG: hypothetical protein WDZ77_01565 [Candidatus Pacearchaeota archaeon]
MIKNVVFGIAIMILTISVGVYGINLVFDSPEYSNFCGEFRTQEIIETQTQCESIGGKWTSYEIKCITDEPCPQGYCDRDYQCRQDYEEAQENYYRNVFFVVVPLGVVLIGLGAFIFGLESVGAGLMGGGVGLILFGVGGFWRFAGDWIKFTLSLLGLAAVIVTAYWFNLKNWNIWKKKSRKKK